MSYDELNDLCREIGKDEEPNCPFIDQFKERIDSKFCICNKRKENTILECLPEDD